MLAPDGLVTRAVYVDIPQHRGTDWADRPVDGADIDAALADAGLVLERGDALCLDMGRDRFEAAAGHVSKVERRRAITAYRLSVNHKIRHQSRGLDASR